jgi:hypothetical protein
LRFFFLSALDKTSYAPNHLLDAGVANGSGGCGVLKIISLIFISIFCVDFIDNLVESQDLCAFSELLAVPSTKLSTAFVDNGKTSSADVELGRVWLVLARCCCLGDPKGAALSLFRFILLT